MKLDDILSNCNKTSSTDEKTNCFVLMTTSGVNSTDSTDVKNEGLFQWVFLLSA